jgi:GAF domain-containing protein
MPSEKKKLTFNGLIDIILQPNTNIKDSQSRQQAHLTGLASLILAGICLVAGIVGLIIGFPASLTVGFFFLTILMSIAFAFGRSENFLVGSILLVSGIILGGFLISSAFPDNISVIIILMSTIVPAFSLSIILLPLLSIIIIAVIVLITIGVLPLMATISASTELMIFIVLAIIQGIFILVAWYRDTSESLQQDEIGSLRGRLEERIEERTRYSRIVAEIAQELASAKTMDELLDQAASQISSRLGFAYAGIFIANEAGHNATLKAAQGSGADKILRTGKRVSFGPSSLLGWVAENKHHRVASRIDADSMLLETELLPENQSEIGIPVLSRDQLLGLLDLQSTRSTVFDNETIVVLEMLSTQLAAAIQNVRRIEVELGSTNEVTEVYLASNKIAQVKTDDEIYRILEALFSKFPYVNLFLTPEGEGLKPIAKTDARLPEGQSLPEFISVSLHELEPFITTDIFIGEKNRLNSLPYNLVNALRQLQIFSAAIIPVLRNGSISGAFIIGTREKTPLAHENLEPYINLVKQIGATLDRIQNTLDTDSRIVEMEADSSLSSEIARAKTEKDILEAVHNIFLGNSKASILLVAENNNLRISASLNLLQEGQSVQLPESLMVAPGEILKQLGNSVLVEEVSKLSALQYAQFHPELQKFVETEAGGLPVLNIELMKLLEQVEFNSVALMPIVRNNELAYLIIVGSRNNQPLSSLVRSYKDVSELITAGFGRIRDEQDVEYRLNQDEVIILMSQEISLIRDLPTLYSKLHAHIRQTLGNVNFLVTLYDENTNSISVPYMFEGGADNNNAVDKIEPFPVGEGLTSVLIRTKQPLMLVEDTEKRALALGAKIAGKPAKSWLGTPMMVAEKIIGTIVVQDTEHEFAFNDNDLRFLTTLSTQIAGTIYNARLLDETRNRAIQLKTAAEIARDISGSINVGELITKAVTLIRERFNYYHAAIFLVDSTNEFAVIREATGEAGNQMKRAGHKLKVGSKSIVGYATGNGEPLIVNDTNRDATYYANPLLPETRAEVAIPLKVGQRILGALDVQSTQAYSFREEDISVLRILADQMAIAVINSELFSDVQEHLSQHRLLHHVTTAAASGTTLEESLTSATQGLQVTLGGDRVSILLADKGKKTLKVRAFAGYSEEVGKLEIPFGEGITGWVAVHQQPQRINDVTQDSRYIQVGSNIRSELAIPLSYRGDLLGVLNVESDQASAYNENDEEMLGTLGGSLAAIISNARLIEQVRRQVDHERMLYEVTSKIRRSTDIQTIMATTAGELSKVLGARRAQIKMGTVDSGPDAGKRVEEADSTQGDAS